MNHKHSCPMCGSSRTSNFLKAPDRLHLRRQTYSLIRCYDCSCVWQPAPPAPQDMRVHYDEDYHAGLINAGSSDPGSRWSQPRDMVLKYGSERESVTPPAEMGILIFGDSGYTR